MVEEMDREIIGAANIYVRAMRWKHLPAAMSFEQFLAAIRRGDDPYLAPCAQARPSGAPAMLGAAPGRLIALAACAGSDWSSASRFDGRLHIASRRHGEGRRGEPHRAAQIEAANPRAGALDREDPPVTGRSQP